MKRNYMYFLIVVLFAAGIALAGCSGAEKAGEEQKPAATEETAAPEAAAEAKTAEGESMEGKLLALCEKVAEESKAAGMPADAADMNLERCKEGVANEQNLDDGNKWAAFILDACKEHTGHEWIMCFSAAAQQGAGVQPGESPHGGSPHGANPHGDMGDMQEEAPAEE